MVKYNCNLCKYEANTSQHLARHFTTQKHLKNQEVENNKQKMIRFNCQNCDAVYASPSGLFKHSKKCILLQNNDTCDNVIIVTNLQTPVQNNILQVQNDNLQTQIKQMQLDHVNEKLKLMEDLLKQKDDATNNQKQLMEDLLKQKDDATNNQKQLMEDLLKQKDEDKNNQKQLMEDLLKQKDDENKRMEKIVQQSGSVVKTTTKALAYLAANYPDAPTLDSFPKLDYELIKGEFNSTPEMIYYTTNHNIFIQHLSSVIVKHLALDEKGKRPLWVADNSRIKFVVCDIIENIKQWVYDENGVEFGKKILDSLFAQMREELQQYIHDAPAKMRAADSVQDMEIIVQIQRAATDTVIKIDDNYIKNGVIRAVAPELCIKTNAQLV